MRFGAGKHDGTRGQAAARCNYDGAEAWIRVREFNLLPRYDEEWSDDDE